MVMCARSRKLDRLPCFEGGIRRLEVLDQDPPGHRVDGEMVDGPEEATGPVAAPEVAHRQHGPLGDVERSMCTIDLTRDRLVTVVERRDVEGFEDWVCVGRDGALSPLRGLHDPQAERAVMRDDGRKRASDELGIEPT